MRKWAATTTALTILASASIAQADEHDAEGTAADDAQTASDIQPVAAQDEAQQAAVPSPDAPFQSAQVDPYPVPPPATMGETMEEHPYADALYAQDVLKVATSLSFAATGVVGILAAINQPTAFGDGRCADGRLPDFGEGIGGEWGCQGMSTLHAALGVGTTVLYVAEGVTGLAIPGDEPDYGVFHDVMTATHITGMILTPTIGLMAAQPNLFGEEDTVDATWPKVGRTIHLSTALITAAAYWTTTLIELTSNAPYPDPYATASRR